MRCQVIPSLHLSQKTGQFFGAFIMEEMLEKIFNFCVMNWNSWLVSLCEFAHASYLYFFQLNQEKMTLTFGEFAIPFYVN